MKNKFRNGHGMLEDFGDEFLVVCPNCTMKSKVISLGDASPYEPGIIKRFICVSCGTTKDYVPKKNAFNQLKISYGVEWKEGFINIGGAFDWYFGYPLYLQIPSCVHTLWAYNLKHLNYLKQYVQAELRENKPYYLSIESRLPVWIKSSKNRTSILKAISKLEQKEMQNQHKLYKYSTDIYINKLEKYVIVNEDKTLSLDPGYVELDIPSTFIDGIEEGLVYLNKLIKSNKAIVHPDLSVTMVDDVNQGITSFSTKAKGCGRSGHDVYWWGYNIFLDCNETRTAYQSFKAGGGATAGIAAISRFIPVPPTQLASAIAGAIGGGLAGFGQMIQDEHEGNGVRIRFTGITYAAVPTGIFPQ